MKITDIKVHIIDMGREHHMSFHGSYRDEVGIVRVFTDEGIEGNADYRTAGFPSKLLGELILAVKPRIIGEDPFNIERIWKQTFRTTRFLMPIYVPGCIDVALWDIVGKALNTPLYRLLGGFRERVRAYASTSTCEDIESFIKLTESLVERGFTAIKVHPWADPDRDIKLCRALRKVVGDDFDLMIDPLGLYDRRGALKVGKVLDELNFYWFEEPLLESDVEGYIDLCRRLDLPVLGQDSLRLSLGNYVDYISRGAFDIVQADTARQGITWTKKLASIAEGFGRIFQTHGMGSPLHQAANLHLGGAINNSDLFEMPAPEGSYDTTMQDAITLDDDGWVTIPQKPGLGLEIDWEKTDKHTIAVIE